MKHIKTFEDIYNIIKKNYDYNIGDYIILNEGAFRKEQYDSFYNMFIITSIPTGNDNTLYVDYYNKDFEEFNTWIFTSEIERLATKDEINDFETKIQSKKYNL